MYNLRLFRIKIVPDKRLVLGLLSICLISALVFSFLSAFFFMVGNGYNYLGSDSVVYFFRQSAFSFRSDQLPLSMAEQVKQMKGVDVVSPEAFVYSFVNGNPVIIRGITPNAYLLSDYFELVEGKLISEYDYQNALVGKNLADILNLTVNDTFIVPSSSISTFSPFRVKGIFRTYSLMDSEILIPLENIWDINTYPERGYASIVRAKVNKTMFRPTNMIYYLPAGEQDLSGIMAGSNEIVSNVVKESSTSLFSRLKSFFGYRPDPGAKLIEIGEEIAAFIERPDYAKSEIENAFNPVEEISEATPEIRADLGQLTGDDLVKAVQPVAESLVTKIRTAIETRDKNSVYQIFFNGDFRAVMYVFAAITFIILAASMFAIISIVANLIFESRNEMKVVEKVGAMHLQASLMLLARLAAVVLLACFIGSVLGFLVLLLMSRLSSIGIAAFPIMPVINIQIIAATLGFTLFVTMASGTIILAKSRFI
jgi:ABC-type antimicrobial peptide transport system permease subunit